MASEAGEDEFAGFGIPIEVDRHTVTRVEAMAERHMQGEEAGHALIGRAVVGGVADLGVLADIAAEVAESGLSTQKLIRLERVSRIGLEFGEGDEAGEVAVQGPVVLKLTGCRLLDGFRQDHDVLGKLGLSHVRYEDILGRNEVLVGLVRRRKGFVDRREEPLPDQPTADLHRITAALGRRAHGEMLRRCQVKADRALVGEECDDRCRCIQGRADHLEGILGDTLDVLQETASREFVAVVETEWVGAHVRLTNVSFPDKFQPARGSRPEAHRTMGASVSHGWSISIMPSLNMGLIQVARNTGKARR